MNFLVWLVFGGLAGWVASLITGSNASMGVLANIVVGVLGAFIGGWIATTFFHEPGVTGFDMRSFVIAVGGAVLLLLVVHLFKH